MRFPQYMPLLRYKLKVDLLLRQAGRCKFCSHVVTNRSSDDSMRFRLEWIDWRYNEEWSEHEVIPNPCMEHLLVCFQ